MARKKPTTTWRTGSNAEIVGVAGEGRSAVSEEAPRCEPDVRRAAFTLIELVLVAVVLSMLLAASIPQFRHTAQRLRAEHSVFEFVQLLRLCHERAVAEGRDILWVWDDEARRAHLYALGTVDGESTANPLEGRFGRSARLADDASVQLEHPEGVDPCPDGVPERAACIQCFPDGTSEPMTMTVAVGRHSYVVTVNEATSHVVLTTRAAAP